MMEVSTNHFELQMESKSFIDSIILFISSSSASTKSYPIYKINFYYLNLINFIKEQIILD